MPIVILIRCAQHRVKYAGKPAVSGPLGVRRRQLRIRKLSCSCSCKVAIATWVGGLALACRSQIAKASSTCSRVLDYRVRARVDACTGDPRSRQRAVTHGCQSPASCGCRLRCIPLMPPMSHEPCHCQACLLGQNAHHHTRAQSARQYNRTERSQGAGAVQAAGAESIQ